MDISIPLTLSQLNAAIYAVFAILIVFSLMRGYAEGFRKSIIHLIVMVVLIGGSFWLAQTVASTILTSEFDFIAINYNGTIYHSLGGLVEGFIAGTPFLNDILASDADLAGELITGVSEMMTRVSLFITFISASLFIVEPIVSGLINLVISPFIKLAGKKKPKFGSRVLGALVAAATTIIHVGVLVSPVIALRPTVSPLLVDDANAQCFDYIEVDIPAEVCVYLMDYGTMLDESVLTPYSGQLVDSLTTFPLNGNDVILIEELNLFVQVLSNKDLPLEDFANLDLATLTPTQIEALGDSITLLGSSKLISPFFPALITYLFTQAGLGDYLEGLDLEGEIDWANELESIANAIQIFATLDISEGFNISELSSEDISDLLNAVGGSEIMQEVIANALNVKTAEFLNLDVEITFWSEVDFEEVAEVASLLLEFNETDTPTEETVNALMESLIENESFVAAIVEDFETNDISFPATADQISQMQTALEESNASQDLIDDILSLFAQE